MGRDVLSGDNMDRILRRPAVQVRSGLSCSTIYDQMRAGKFPRPVPLGEKAVGWLESEILAPKLVERGFERVRKMDGWWWKGVTVRNDAEIGTS